MRGFLYFCLIALYCAWTFIALQRASAPVFPCPLNKSTYPLKNNNQNASGKEKTYNYAPKRCYGPAVNRNDTLMLDLWTTQDSSNREEIDGIHPIAKWAKVDSCSDIPLQLSESEIRYDNCTITLPIQSRRRGNEGRSLTPLKAKFVVRRIGIKSTEADHRDAVADAFLDLTVFEPKWNSTLGAYVSTPHYKYGGQRLVLRFVEEYRGFKTLERGDGIVLRRHMGNCHVETSEHNNQFCYEPLLYVDDMALRSTSWIEMASTEYHKEKGPVKLNIKVSFISPMRDSVLRQVSVGIQMAESIFHKSELDEIKYLISDEHIYRFVLTQIISFVHIWLDFMAFKDEVKFYVGRTDMGGVSMSSVLWRFVCSLVIFLYLWDAGTTSSLVLGSVGMGVVTDAWKSWKMLKPSFHFAAPFFVRLRDPSKLSRVENETAKLDRIGRTYVGLVLYPLLVGSALYSRQNYSYKSYWSWIISNAANAVYTFGFIALCPQLYINYRLKSVAHLPWKVFMYKIFNTFIDDAFAFLIEMPLTHKIMTLRDDVVFLGFLYQTWIYRVDKSRPNEFGYAYSESDTGENSVELKNERQPTNVSAVEADLCRDLKEVTTVPESDEKLEGKKNV